ncbi:HEPN domain-containing protein [Candidatus Woesearchaeota archaeon]|nr:HEPN domain-containing protein [Candidatus Woesearchaeota archaeon]
MKEEIKLWWSYAEADLKTAEHAAEAGDYYAAGFWAQQAVEKGLKALVLYKGSEFRKIHDLETLAKKVDATAAIIDKCKKISPAYTIARYPDAALKPAKSVTKEEAEELVKLAKEVLEWAKNQMR